MATKLLYYRSLEDHMQKYMEQVKLNEFNEEYQSAQARIVRESESMSLTQAETINRLKQLQSEIEKKASTAVIPLSKTNAPETKTSFTKPTIRTLASRSSSPKSPLFEEMAGKKLKKTPSPESKPKAKSPFQAELEQKIQSRSRGSSRASSPTFSEAPTEGMTESTSGATTGSKGTEDLPKSNYKTVEKQFRDYLSQKYPNNTKKINQKLNKMTALKPEEKIPYMNRKISGGGLSRRKKVSKKKYSKK